MSNVTLTARTWNLTGTRYFYFLNSRSQQPGWWGQQFPFGALRCSASSRNRAVTFLWPSPRNCLHPGPRLGRSRIPQGRKGVNTAVLTQQQQWAPKKPYVLTRQHVSGKMGTHRAGSQPCPSPKYATVGTCCMGYTKTGSDKKSSLLFQLIFLGIRQILNNTGMHKTINISTAKGRRCSQVENSSASHVTSGHSKAIERSNHQKVGLHWEIQNEDELLFRSFVNTVTLERSTVKMNKYLHSGIRQSEISTNC